MAIIVVAGATGNLGCKIVNALVEKGAVVHAIVRQGSNKTALENLAPQGVKVFTVSNYTLKELVDACVGADCVISALAGLEEVIIDAQKALADAAMQAGVPRFIPSDYSLDFTNLVPGKNRNLDLRRTFHEYLVDKPLAVTSIFNGAFTELLTGEMPLILSKIKRVLYWGNANVQMDFTHTNDVAKFTAAAALDPTTPRYLYIHGDRMSSSEVRTLMSELREKQYTLLRPGGIGLLNFVIKIAKKLLPGTSELYPAWQGMQYMRDMMEGRAVIQAYDNNRYEGIQWTTIKEYLLAQNV
jgi:nucleoside-diphosphate-sugar epimerase